MNKREIKFRVWDMISNGWVHGPGRECNLFGEMILLGGFMLGISIDKLNSCIALQYTGIKDKGGKEIYEGDIVSSEEATFSINANCKDFVAEVKFGGGCFYANCRSGLYEYVDLLKIKYSDLTIIGNVFETPHLLK